MSGGQQAQLALTLALARRPQLLVLDEPMASLDPLARHDFMATVMAAVADDGLSCCCPPTSSRTSSGSATTSCCFRRPVQVVGEVDDLLAHHRVLTGPSEYERYRGTGMSCTPATTRRGFTFSSADDGSAHPVRRDGGTSHHPGRTELAYLREPGAAALPGPSRSGGSDRSASAK